MPPLFVPLLLPPASPLDRLVGDWTSVESVETPQGKKVLRLKGRNRWVFRNDLLEIREEYRVEGDPETGRNHILMRALEGDRLVAWWYAPKAAEPLAFDGAVEEGGMTLTRRDGRMRLVYRWDGDRAYDARLQTRRKAEDPWADRTVARYTRK